MEFNISITIATQMAQLSIAVNETQLHQLLCFLVIIMSSRDLRVSFWLLHQPAWILRGLGLFKRMLCYSSKMFKWSVLPRFYFFVVDVLMLLKCTNAF